MTGAAGRESNRAVEGGDAEGDCVGRRERRKCQAWGEAQWMAKVGEEKGCRGNGVMSWSCLSGGVVRSGRGGKGRVRRQTEAKKGEVSDTEDSGDIVISCDISCKIGRQNIKCQRAYDARFPRSDVSGYNSPGASNSSCLAPLKHTFLAADICHATSHLRCHPATCPNSLTLLLLWNVWIITSMPWLSARWCFQK